MTKIDSPDAAADGPLGPPWQGGPFVLLDDARGSGAARLYRNPVEIVEARTPEEVRPALARLRGASAHAAGFLGYEAGHALEPKLAPLARAAGEDAPPLLWFGLFDGAEAVDPSRLADPAGAWAGAPSPLVGRDSYRAAVARVKAHIRAGDVYQANLTFPAAVATAGHPIALYAALRRRARGGHGALVFTGRHWLLSFSPELFFELEEGGIVTRPMKGTARRGADPAADAEAIREFAEDPKQRAENLMIVDLLRNDLSRVSRPGTVKVPSLFAVETYPTVHQMTSTIVSKAEPGIGPWDVVEAIFPCGSVTGAPKIRAMEIIAAVETGARGPYTGSIGRVSPDGSAAFNVAIRTLVMRDGETEAVLGLGSGIVADSEAEAEWRECLAKGVFVEEPIRFDLIETMRFDPREGIVDLERHLARMKRSAGALGFAFDRHDARNELQAATFHLREPRRLRLLLSKSGALAVEARRVPETPEGPVSVACVPLPVDASDFRLRHKTTDRRFYDDARIASGAFEAVFVDAEGFVTEGSFTSVFVEREGMLLTPPLSRGLLPGILRERLLDEGRARDADLRPEDLAGGFLIGNALRGLMDARLA